MRKIRSDAVLDNLPADRVAKLDEWLLDDRLSLNEARDKLEKEFGVVVGRDAVHRYHQGLQDVESLERLRETAALARELPEGWREEAAEVQAVSRYLVLNRIMEKLLLGNCTTREIIALGKLLVKFEEMALRKRKVEGKVISNQEGESDQSGNDEGRRANAERNPKAKTVESRGAQGVISNQRPVISGKGSGGFNSSIHEALVAAKLPGARKDRSVNELVEQIVAGKEA